MKKSTFLFCLLLVLSRFSFAQPTWSEHTAEIFYNHCTVCHNPEGIGPFSLLGYETAYDYAGLISAFVEYNVMPPWTADTSFQHYYGERILTEYERSTIIEWASGGALEGDPGLAPAPPVYSGEQVLPGVPDLTIEMPLYMSKATEVYDDYVCISIPTGLTEDRRIKAVEVIPGNRSIVHHCLVYSDPDGDYETDTIGGNCGGPTTEAFLISGYTPGASPAIFPSSEDFSTGMLLEAGGNIILTLHYPHGSYGEYDQTKVNFYFYDEPVLNFREIIAGPFVSNWEFELLANEFTTVHAEFENTPAELSVLSTFPHMHLLGDYIEAYALTPDLDTIPFIRIPHWDFDWQDFYWFRYMQRLPAASDIKAKAIYNNTSSNTHNPSDPPVDVYPGSNTTDEMFIVYFHIMAYESGDELINVDSLNRIYLSNEFQENPIGDKTIKAYPNPFNENITIEYTLEKQSRVSARIYDLQGKLVQKLFLGDQSQGVQQLVWDGSKVNGGDAPTGLYSVSMLIDRQHYARKILKY